MARPSTRPGSLPIIRKHPITDLRAIVLSCLVGSSLLLSSLVLAAPPAVVGEGQARRGHPEAGPPTATLPNLDEVRQKRHPRPVTPTHSPSELRSRRRALTPRNGRKVGDPGTTEGTIGGAGETDPGTTPANASRREDANTKFDDNSAKTAQGVPLRSFGPSPKSSTPRSSSKRLNHPRPRGLGLSPTPIGEDQYVQTFFQWALGHTPTTTEQAYWNDILRAAYAHAQTSMVMAAREMGKTLFESAEYAARARSNHDYVYDLYQTYLLRGPDSGGWAYWESVVPGIGRENVRRAFDESGEFISKVATVTLTGGASSTVTSVLTARVDVANQSGNQLVARDAEWEVTLLSLPGRAGPDLISGWVYLTRLRLFGPVPGPTFISTMTIARSVPGSGLAFQLCRNSFSMPRRARTLTC